MKKLTGALMIAVSAVAFTANAQAAELEYKPYVAADYHYTDANAHKESPYYNSGSVSVGTSYNKYFGTELFYQYSNDYKKSNRTTGEKRSSQFQAYGLDMIGYLPLGCDQVFSLLGTIGIGEYKFEKKNGFMTIGSHKHNDSGYGYRAGLGAQYQIDENWSVRAIARYIGLDKVKDFDHMMDYSMGVKYSF